MSILKVDTINEKTSGNGVAIPGHVVQVVYGALSSIYSYSSSVTADHDILTVNITPKFNTSKILLTGNFGHYLNSSNLTDRGDYVFKRGSTNIFATGTDGFGYFRFSGFLKSMNNTHNYLDSPATTSSVAYTLHHTIYTNSAGGAFGPTVTNLTLMEIAQ
tara:strand:+ start:145 stop:624 length:480 start_codon:yes stop_codon:yes gene_type:complete